MITEVGLEEEANNNTAVSILTKEEKMAEDVDSVFVMLRFLKLLKVDYGLRSLSMARAPPQYYTWTLE